MPSCLVSRLEIYIRQAGILYPEGRRTAHHCVAYVHLRKARPRSVPGCEDIAWFWSCTGPGAGVPILQGCKPGIFFATDQKCIISPPAPASGRDREGNPAGPIISRNDDPSHKSNVFLVKMPFLFGNEMRNSAG